MILTFFLWYFSIVPLSNIEKEYKVEQVARDINPYIYLELCPIEAKTITESDAYGRLLGVTCTFTNGSYFHYTTRITK